MKKILIIGPFPPAYSYGGPTRSIEGIYNALRLSNDLSCKVISPAKNLDGSNLEIETIDKNIKYTNNSYKEILNNISQTDLIWFNSFFEFKLVFLVLLSKIFNFKLIISPRGQLADSAINTSNHSLKKIFIKFISVFKSKINFHSTGDYESEDIISKIKTSKITYLSNLFSLNFCSNSQTKSKYIFYSRIHKKKGLYYLLKILDEEKINLDLDIYGYIEDIEYWEKCKKIINKLINVNYMGSIENGDIKVLKNKYSFFILPTLNENYGHVIIELLSLGIIPIISSSTTPFDSILNKKIGLNFNLNSRNELVDILTKTNQIDLDSLSHMKNSVFEIFSKLNRDQEIIKNDYTNFVKQLCK